MMPYLLQRTAVICFSVCALSAISAIAQGAVEISNASGSEYRFNQAAGGAEPSSGLVSDGAGNFYGTTISGGLANCGQYGPYCGTVFKVALAENGRFVKEVIYEFTGGSDGGKPEGTLTLNNGSLYGTTAGIYGGSSDQWGNVFELSLNHNGAWTETTLYNFQGTEDGGEPTTGVIFDSVGNLYGTTPTGGAYNYGTVFELTPNEGGLWSETILYNFLDAADGYYPSRLVFDTAGNLYGTTEEGGDSQYLAGTVFELSPSQGQAWNKTILHNFAEGVDGGLPNGPVTFDDSGNLYGETIEGGSLECPGAGCGVVYEISPQGEGSWQFSVAHTFNGPNGSKGNEPYGGLSLDSGGNLYGTTYVGGSLANCSGVGCGTIFELSPAGGGHFAFRLLGAFDGQDGEYPFYGVLVDEEGNLFGTTSEGGDFSCALYQYGCGVVFELNP